MPTTAPTQASPVKTLADAAAYVGRSPNALKILRHRRRGPRSFLADGRIYYFVVDLDAWLAEHAAADGRYNPAHDPTTVPPRVRRSRPRTATA